MRALRGRLQSYVPQVLLDWYAANGADRHHTISGHSGILLFADASGFTALTRRLSQKGREGSEILTAVLNQVFTSLDRVVRRHQGDILKFSGDALWCFFPENTPVAICFGEMLANIEELNLSESVCRENPIGLHAGAAAGDFYLISLGNAQSRLECEMIGSVVSAVYKAADLADSRELVVHESLASSLGKEQPQECESPGFYLLRPSCMKSANTDLDHDSAGDEVTAEDSAVAPYVPEMVRKRLAELDKHTELASEHRRVAVLFVEIAAPMSADSHTENEYKLLENVASKIFVSIDTHDGSVARIDPFGSGHKLLVLFGALARGQHDEMRALQAAREIVSLSASSLRISAGLTSGRLFCGEVGSKIRREYTVMGEAVNMAARLMSKADAGKLLMDDAFLNMVGGACRTRQLQFALKGVGDSVTVHEFLSLREEGSGLPDTEGFIGRTEQLRQLHDAYNRALAGGSNLILITGEPGIGKTTLCAKFAEEAAPDEVVYISATPCRLHQPGYLISTLIRHCLDKDSDKIGNNSSVLEKIASLGLLDEKWRPLLRDLLALPTDENEWTKGLSAGLRLEKTAELVRSIVAGAPYRPRLLLLDDLEAADTFSLSLLQRLVQDGSIEDGVVLLIGSTIPPESQTDRTLSIDLKGLTEAEMDNVLTARMASGRREMELIELVKSKSEGSPLFLRQTIESLLAAGAVASLSNSERLEVVKPLGEIKLADRIEDLQLSEFDRLPESYRSLLKAASVLVDSLQPSTLAHLLNGASAEQIASQLNDLMEEGLLRRLSDHEYTFRRSMTRDAIYGCIPSSDRRAMHLQVGELLLSTQPEADLSRLAYHFARADDAARGFKYSLDAGQKAKEKLMLIEAAERFQHCDRIITTDGAGVVDDNLKLLYYRRASEFAVLEGNYAHAFTLLREGRHLARRMNNREQYLFAANDFAALLWRQSRFSRLRQCLSVLLRAKSDSRPELLSRTFSILGELNRRNGSFCEAQKACRKAILLAQEAGDKESEANACNNLGLACWGGGDLDGARNAFETGMKLGRGKLGKYAEAKASNNLAIISEEMGDYINAEKLLRRARAIFEDIGDRRNVSYASGNLANILTYFGCFREALELFEAADRVFIKLGEEHPHIYTQGNIADIEMVLGRHESAFSRYQQVAEFARQSGDKELEAETRIRIAEYELYCGGISRARTLYAEGIALATEIGSLEYQTRGTIGICRLLIGEREAGAAQEQIERLFDYAEQTRSNRTRFEAEFLAGEKARIEGDADGALMRYRRARDYARSQKQFELELKCNVRIYEVSPDSREQSATALRQLLADFATAEGEGTLQSLLDSPYYRYFSMTLRGIRSAESSVDSPQSVG